jgi:hypothetical protein
MANVVKKHSISPELAQKMVDKAVAKARELGVSENVAILDDGGISKHSAEWMGPSRRCFGTVEDFENLFATTSEARSSATSLMRRCFGRKRSKSLGRRAARAWTRRDRSCCNGGGKNGSAPQTCTGDGDFPWNWTSHCVGAC